MPIPPLLRGAAARASSAIATAAGFSPRTREQERILPSSKGGEEQGQLQSSRTQAYTYFTVVGGTHLLYAAENWVRITMALEDAGPVAVGTSANLAPVLSGRGILLDTVPSAPFVATLPRGTRIYVAAENVNRVKVLIEPIPWLEQLDADIGRVAAAVGQAASSIVQGITAAISGLTGATPPSAPAPTTTGGTRLDQIPRPIPDRLRVPRLTSLRTPPKMR